MAEGGITRFAAVFQSTDPGDVGPIRSVRGQDADLAAPLQGLAVFAGGIPDYVTQVGAVAQNLSTASSLGEGPPSAGHRPPSAAQPVRLRRRLLGPGDVAVRQGAPALVHLR